MATSTITGTITGPTGVAVSGARVVCTLMPQAGFRTADGSEVARTVETTTNASGVYTFVLERNAGISPINSWYELTEYIPVAVGGTRTWTIAVGVSNQTVYASLVTPTLDPPTVISTAAATILTQQSADARYQALSAIGTDTPTTSAVADAAAAGSSTAASRGDHRHGREAFATPVAVLPTGNAAGSAATLPRSDHVHQGTGTVGYASVSADQSGITAETDLTNFTVTVTTVASRRYRVSIRTSMSRTVYDGLIRFRIKEGATNLSIADGYAGIAGGGPVYNDSVVLTPSAGAHTYKVSAERITGTGTVGINPGAMTTASYILVEDIGT